MKARLIGIAVIGLLVASLAPAAVAFAHDDDDDETELEGIVESLPTGTLIGDWKVSGTIVGSARAAYGFLRAALRATVEGG